MTELTSAATGIRQLHARYTDAVWRQDARAFAECFTEQGEWRISGMILRGRPEIETTINKILSNFIRVLITFREPIIDLAEDGMATARTYITEHCAWKNGETNISIGRYYERLVCDGEQWLFAWRLFQLHYRGPPDLTGTFFDHPDFGPPPGMPDLNASTADMASARWGLTGRHE